MKIFSEISCFLDLVGSSPSLLHKILIQNPLQRLALLSVEMMPLQLQSLFTEISVWEQFLFAEILFWWYSGASNSSLQLCEWREKQVQKLVFLQQGYPVFPAFNPGYMRCISGMLSFSRQQERQMARQLAFLAAEPTSVAECEFAFLYVCIYLFITTINSMELLVSNAF